MIKVISATAELTGDLDKAIYWYRNEPIADYGHRTAANWWPMAMSRQCSPISGFGKRGARVKPPQSVR